MTKRYFPQPLSLPFGATTLGWLFLDYTKAPQWAFGVFWTLIAICWIVAIVLVIARFKDGCEPLDANEVEKRLAALEARR